MNDKLLDKLTKRNSPDSASSPGGDGEDAENFGCFGWLRGVRDRAMMLELRKKDGHALGVAYSWLERVEFVPEQGIILHLPGKRIRITGSGLNRDARGTYGLFDGILRHRVPWVREQEESELVASAEGAIAVERIDWDE